ncbi:MAG: capsular polysaccharide synthesis protein [Cucumibacter sp.]
MEPAARPYSRNDFRGVFLRKYATLLRALVDPKLKKRPMNEALVAELAAEFAGLYSRPAARGAVPVPRHIWMLWQQGWDKAPALVQACARSWAQRNPGWELHLLDDATLDEYAPGYRGIPAPGARRPARANLARVSLLCEHGGVWADATLFCSRGLDDWLPGVWDAGFFMFTFPRPYRPSDNWFIASAPNSWLLAAMRNIFTQYWSLFGRPHHYFWMHYLLEYLTEIDPRAGEIWSRMPRIPAGGPLIVGAYAFDRQAPQQVFDLIERGTVPLHKLSHKWRHRGSLAGTPLGRLTGLAHL